MVVSPAQGSGVGPGVVEGPGVGVGSGVGVGVAGVGVGVVAIPPAQDHVVVIVAEYIIKGQQQSGAGSGEVVVFTEFKSSVLPGGHCDGLVTDEEPPLFTHASFRLQAFAIVHE